MEVPSLTVNWRSKTLIYCDSYTGSKIVADVSYDTWLAPTATGNASYEVMIWLAGFGGVLPYGDHIASPTVGSTKIKLFTGPHGDTTVFTFVAGSTKKRCSGDLVCFYHYLVANQGVSSRQYLQSIGAGTEPFIGSNAEFKVTAYSAKVKYKVKEIGQMSQ